MNYLVFKSLMNYYTVHHVTLRGYNGVKYHFQQNFSYIILWRSVLFVKVPGENHQPATIHRQTLSHNVVSSTPRHQQD
jgi:hypothetical protein